MIKQFFKGDKAYIRDFFFFKGDKAYSLNLIKRISVKYFFKGDKLDKAYIREVFL